MFKEGDIIVSSLNNAESVFENPVPRYKIVQIGMGRVFAENLMTGEIEDLAGGGDVEFYYELLEGRE